MNTGKKPNILFLFTDDQRFDALGAIGNPHIHTPNLDRLAARGVLCTHAHIPGGTSPAVCMPSRAMLHTGRTLFHVEREGQGIPESHTLMGEAFRRAGYRTFGTGKWHNGAPAYVRSFTDGAAILFGGMWDHWNVPLSDFDPAGRYDNLIPFTPDFMHQGSPTKVHCDRFSTGRHSTDVMAEASIEFIRDYDAEDPFFMYVSFLAPHDPRTMPEKYLQMYDPARIPVPPNFAEAHPFDYGVRDIRDERLAPYPRTTELVQEHLSHYYAMISHLDDEIGRIIAALEARQLLDDTVIVLTGDNGLAVGQHGLFGKQSLYEHSVRVPLLLAGPDLPQGERCDALMYLLDLFPTLCVYAGVPTPDSVEGFSMLDAIRSGGPGAREQLYLAYTDQVRGIRDRRFKLIEYRTETCRRTQLFDTTEDPHEMNDLSESADHHAELDRLRGLLMNDRDQWDDTAHPLGKAFWDRY